MVALRLANLYSRVQIGCDTKRSQTICASTIKRQVHGTWSRSRGDSLISTMSLLGGGSPP